MIVLYHHTRNYYRRDYIGIINAKANLFHCRNFSNYEQRDGNHAISH